MDGEGGGVGVAERGGLEGREGSGGVDGGEWGVQVADDGELGEGQAGVGADVRVVCDKSRRDDELVSRLL